MTTIPKIAPGAKIAFLFGAGASYGYTANVKSNPPLGTQLLGILQKHPRCGTWQDPKIVAHFESHGNGFETAMVELADECERHPLLDQMTIELCRYLAQFKPAPNKANCYADVARLLRDRGRITHTLLSSINYECLLEETLLLESIPFEYLLDPYKISFPLPHATVLKIHGSVNFHTGGQLAMTGIKSNCTGHFPGSPFARDVLQSPLETFRPGDEHRAAYRSSHQFTPQIAHYARSKEGMGKPVNYNGNIRDLAVAWGVWARDCDAVIVIGANADVPDGHLWDPVLMSKAAVYYAGGNPGDLQKAPGGFHFIGDDPGRHDHFGAAIEPLSEIL